MAHVAFDTLKFVEALIQAGMPEKQAKALSVVQNEAFQEATDSMFATKTDVLEVKQQIVTSEAKLEQQIVLCASRLDQKITELKGSQTLLQWMMGFVLTGVAAIVIKTFFT